MVSSPLFDDDLRVYSRFDDAGGAMPKEGVRRHLYPRPATQVELTPGLYGQNSTRLHDDAGIGVEAHPARDAQRGMRFYQQGREAVEFHIAVHADARVILDDYRSRVARRPVAHEQLTALRHGEVGRAGGAVAVKPIA